MRYDAVYHLSESYYDLCSIAGMPHTGIQFTHPREHLMNLNTHRKLLIRRWSALGSFEPIKVIALLVVAIVPGGLVLPVCYAAYEAIRRSLPARPMKNLVK